jgi:alpha-glucosidase
VLGNHDQPRIAARVGEAQARIAAMLLLTLRGTPTMYYGDELGLARVDVPFELAQDPWEKNEPGLGVGRDPWRTPFQWDASSHAGFTTGRPWLPLDPEFRSRNVEALSAQPRSILSLYRRLIDVRKQHQALSIGTARVIAVVEDVLWIERSHESEKLMVVLNFGTHDHAWDAIHPGGVDLRKLSLLLSTQLDREGAPSGLLRANEGVILRVR